MTTQENHTGGEEVTHHDDRPIGIAISRDLLRVGDKVNVIVEAQMMDLPTSLYLTYKNVVYRGVTERGHQFDDELEPRYFRDHEILRVALAEV
jgi:hypothetical protein